jgi:hypothetical protein
VPTKKRRWKDAMAVSPTTAVFHVSEDPAQGFVLVEVEGALRDEAVVRWAVVLRGTLNQALLLVILDLRGCQTIEPHCLTVLLSVAATLKASGGSIAAVTLLGSPMRRFLQPHAWDLPHHASVQLALASRSAAL